MQRLKNPPDSRLADVARPKRQDAAFDGGTSGAGNSSGSPHKGITTLTGIPVSPGCAQGRGVILGVNRPASQTTPIRRDQIDTEIAHFHATLRDTHGELEELQSRIRSELGSASADLFSAHLLFLEDPQFAHRVEASIQDDLLSLESAIQVTLSDLVRLLQDADDAYACERSADIRDLQCRLLDHIVQSGMAKPGHLAPESILVATELLPSDLLRFERRNLVGIITETGSETSHTAILARALGIPAVTGIVGVTRTIQPDTSVFIDGESGEIVLGSAPPGARSRGADKKSHARAATTLVDAGGHECITRDGVAIQLFANIGSPLEVNQVAGRHLGGVGLFRTEYLFLNDRVGPSFQRQREIYCGVAASLEGLPLVIRTFDLGGDKSPAFLDTRPESNSNRGVRGLRFSLLESEHLFRAQIRAVLHAANAYDVQIMLPMVLGPGDLQQALTVIQRVAEEEEITDLPPVGTLIETPSAVFAIEEILAGSDFISIGTNDLSHFILAADRNAVTLREDNAALHPSVLRAVHRVFQAANAAGKPVTVCGEAAADPHAACLLIGLGARKLSMSPVSAGRVRCAIRASHHDALDELAQAALNSDSAQTVSALVSDALQYNCPDCRLKAVSV